MRLEIIKNNYLYVPGFITDDEAQLLAKKFKEMKCKVFFSADGCDELFGGQQLYWKLFYKNKNDKKNISPYSSINNFGIKFKDFNTEFLKNLQSLFIGSIKKVFHLKIKALLLHLRFCFFRILIV